MQYIFTGKVYPERAGVTLPEVMGEIAANDVDFNGTIRVSILASQVCVLLNSSSPFSVVDFKNTVESFANTIVDVYGYLNGYSFSVEISSVFIPETGYTEVFGVDVVEITQDSKSRPTNYDEAIQLAFKIPALRMVLKDLRDAVKKPHDTFFHCRRATETISKYFTATGNTKKGWTDMISTLSVSETDLALIQSKGGDQRHGKYRSENGEERVSIMMKTWKIVDQFIIYLKSQN